MNTADRIKSRAYRVLKELPNYHDMRGEKTLTSSHIQQLPLQANEIYIGRYENIPGNIEESIIITNIGLYLYRQEDWRHISFYEMKQVSIPSQRKDADYLIILSTDERIIEIPVKGRGVTGKSRDILDFWRFIDRVIRKDIPF